MTYCLKKSKEEKRKKNRELCFHLSVMSSLSRTVYGVFQVRILEWVAISFSRGQTRVFLHCRQTLYPLTHQGITSVSVPSTVQCQIDPDSCLVWPRDAAMHQKDTMAAAAQAALQTCIPWRAGDPDKGYRQTNKPGEVSEG